MDGSFFVYGHDLLSAPEISGQTSGGQDDAGGITVSSGDAAFPGGYVIEFHFSEVEADGDLTIGARLTEIRVYANSQDLSDGTVLYTYLPAAGQGELLLSQEPEAMGDGYLLLDLTTFESLDAGAPELSSLLVMPGSDIANSPLPETIDHHADYDLDGDDSLTATELGDGVFNIGLSAALYAPTTSGNGVVEGTENADFIDASYLGDPEGDLVDVGDGSDGSDDDVISAGAGNDTVLAGAGNDSIDGGLGDDHLEGGDGNDIFLGGAGNDKIYAGTGDDSGVGGEGNDSFEAYDGNDFFDGGAGDDWMNGDRGDDTLLGGDGNDWMRASYGNDYMEGGRGDDYIWSGYGDDTIRLENDFGNDTILMEGVDEVVGDTLDLSAITDDLTLDLRSVGFGQGTLSDGVSNASFEDVEHLILGSGNNTLILADFSGYDVVQGFKAPVQNPDGSYTTFDRLDLSGMTDEDGNPLTVANVTVVDDGAGNAQLYFPKGESIKFIGVSPADLDSPEKLIAIGLPAVPRDGQVEGTAGNDLIDADYLGDPEGDRIDAGDAIDPVAGGDDDLVYAGYGNDTVLAGEGADTVHAEFGDDSVEGGAGNDYLIGGAGNDTLLGGEGDDTLLGGDGDDLIEGGGGEDWLEGYEGADRFVLGAGDIANGGSEDDSFFADGAALTPGDEISVFGGSEGEIDGDILTVQGPATISYSDETKQNGTVYFKNGATLHFNDIETINYVPCFTAQTRIKTFMGELPAAELKVGDRVLTRDDGFQQIRWIGQRHLSREELLATPVLRPVRISAGALGHGQPERDLIVSPQHRMLLCDVKVSLWFGEEEVLVPAIHLTCLDGVKQMDEAPVTYVHFMFDEHQLVQGDGAWSESFQPGDLTLAGMDTQQRAEILRLFPELRDRGGAFAYPAARPTLSGQDCRVLFS